MTEEIKENIYNNIELIIDNIMNKIFKKVSNMEDYIDVYDIVAKKITFLKNLNLIDNFIELTDNLIEMRNILINVFINCGKKNENLTDIPIPTTINGYKGMTMIYLFFVYRNSNHIEEDKIFDYFQSLLGAENNEFPDEMWSYLFSQIHIVEDKIIYGEDKNEEEDKITLDNDEIIKGFHDCFLKISQTKNDLYGKIEEHINSFKYIL